MVLPSLANHVSWGRAHRDPQINRALAEAAEHYGVFVDPCRMARSADKGKVERFVQGCSKPCTPSADLGELNRRALQWCRPDYGRREHGTTGVAPMEAFEVERPTLKALPAERFEVPEWKQVSVHAGDQFLTFKESRFSLPPAWRGLRVWARYAAPLLQLYDDNERLIRQYVLNDRQRIYWVAEDFPAEVRTMMNGGYPGCARTRSTGGVLFGNVLRRGGHWIPPRRMNPMLSDGVGNLHDPRVGNIMTLDTYLNGNN